MAITGYGEDALCYWALSCRLREIVGTDDATVLYRPSFGRRGSKPEKHSTQFGEFDAIIGTSTTVHLVEAKWRWSSEIRKGQITLRPEQIRRHEIFRAYLQAWWGKPEQEDWGAFYARTKGWLTVEGIDRPYPLPKPGKKLAANLKAILDLLKKQEKAVEDVLLYLALAGETAKPTPPDKFKLAFVRTGSPDGFVELPPMP